MEKKLILVLYICSIKYMGLVLWLWSYLELNDNAYSYSYSTKNRPFCVFTYCEKGTTILVIVNFFFLFSLFMFLLLHGSKLHREVQPCNSKYGLVQIILNCATRFMATVQSCNWKYGKVQMLLNRAVRFMATF